jgi:type III secretory pathway component EscU
MDGKTLIKSVKGWVKDITEVGVLLIALSVVLALLLGENVPFLSGAADVVNNITAMISNLGEQGMVGLIALGVILYIFNRKEKAA